MIINTGARSQILVILIDGTALFTSSFFKFASYTLREKRVIHFVLEIVKVASFVILN